MAAYAALVSLMHIIDDLKRHHSPPISLNKQQVQSLTENVMFLQEFLEAYDSPVSDEADPLEMRIADAAYAAEDAIESHIVAKIQLSRSREANNSPVSDEADPLEMRIADAAYAAEDAIESHIVTKIQLRRSRETICSRFLSCFRAPEAPKTVSPNVSEFLEAYNSPVSNEADPLEMRIADAAYAAEDTITSHIEVKIQLSRSREAYNSPVSDEADLEDPKTVSSNHDDDDDEEMNLFRDMQNVIQEMDQIKSLAMQRNTEKVVLHDTRHSFISASSSTEKNNSGTVVWSEGVVNGILERLVSDQRERQVIPITGMGGIGKTTLAKTVYSKKIIEQRFDVCAWATISQQYNTREILCELVSQATKKTKEQLSEKSEDGLGLELHQYLSGRRFLIVMDDMWSIEAWDRIQRFFPENENYSRILVTTRLSHLSSQLNNNYSLQMEFLDEVRSWELFSKIVFGVGSCPHELEKIGKKIVENCRGLPLSIVVVGGILRNREHTLGVWESISQNLASEVNLDNDKFCMELLKMSYNHLPVYLKPCFLYMGVFEEDDSVRVSTLVKLWVSEGFLKPMNDKSLETIAIEFLKDLVDRNLILVDKVGSTGNIKFVKIHDLLRDLCLNQSKKDGFYHVIGQSSPRCMSSQSRVVIPRNTPKKKVLDNLQSMPRARSIISEYRKVPRIKNSGLLRTLHAYKFPYFEYDRHVIKYFASQYVNLRHLAFEVGSMSSIFTSFTCFWNLHILIVSCFEEFTAPAEIWRMPQLRHIEMARGRFYLPEPSSDDVVVMENLLVLERIANFKCSEEVVKRIPNIKKLGIEYLGRGGIEQDYYYYLNNIKRLCKLESLSVWCCPYALTFPQSLKKLTLRVNDGFEWEKILEKIGSMPFLEKFKLWFGCFGTGKWEMVEGQFPSLKYLGLHWCRSLKHWTAESNSIFPRLETLHLFEMVGLKEIPTQIGDIPTLQKIWMHSCGESAVMCAKEIVEEQVELQGEDLPFHVQVLVYSKNEAVQSLAGPNFEVLCNSSN